MRYTHGLMGNPRSRVAVNFLGSPANLELGRCPTLIRGFIKVMRLFSSAASQTATCQIMANKRDARHDRPFLLPELRRRCRTGGRFAARAPAVHPGADMWMLLQRCRQDPKGIPWSHTSTHGPKTHTALAGSQGPWSLSLAALPCVREPLVRL